MTAEEHSISPDTAGENVSGDTGGGSGTRRVRRAALSVALVATALFVAALGFDVATAAPEICSSCHEMELRAHSWSESAHAGVTCVKCHQAPTEWYQLPQRIAGRVALLGRDISSHLSGDYPDPVDGPAPGSEPMSDEVCLQCHDPNRKATSGFRILIDHAEHAERNGSCVSCHVRTAHPVETRGGTLTLMAQCYTCHGTGPEASAPAECGVCHPSGYELLPASHKEDVWAKEHGTVVAEDAQLCEMCHSRSFCTDCHGVEMPHPQGWAKGRTGHAVTAERDRAICGRCHGSTEDMCTMCHHDAYDPTKGTWVKQHADEVSRRGTAFCFDCHAPTACVRCHASPQGAGEQ